MTRLFLGAKRNNIGHLSIRIHRAFRTLNSLKIKRESGIYTVSFCYEEELDISKIVSITDHLSEFKNYRAVARPAQAEDEIFAIKRLARLSTKLGQKSLR